MLHSWLDIVLDYVHVGCHTKNRTWSQYFCDRNQSGPLVIFHFLVSLVIYADDKPLLLVLQLVPENNPEELTDAAVL